MQGSLQGSKRCTYILATLGKDLSAILKNVAEFKGKDDEVIVVDGACADHVKLQCEESGLVDVLVSEPDKSMAHAMNKGVLLAKGEVITQITDDDTRYPEHSTLAIDKIIATPEVDVVVTGGHKTFLAGGWTKRTGDINFPVGTNYGKQVNDVFSHGACGNGLHIRKRAFARVGLFNTQFLVWDNEFVLQAIFRKCDVRFLRYKVYEHTVFDYSGIVKSNQRVKGELAMLHNISGNQPFNIATADQSGVWDGEWA